MASGRESLLGNKEGMKSQGKPGKQQKRNQLKEVVIKCEAGDFQGVFSFGESRRQCSGTGFQCFSFSQRNRSSSSSEPDPNTSLIAMLEELQFSNHFFRVKDCLGRAGMLPGVLLGSQHW